MPATKYRGWVRGSSGFGGFSIYYKLIDESKPFNFENVYNIIIVKSNRYEIIKVLHKNWLNLIANEGIKHIGFRSKLESAIRLANSEISKHGKVFPSK